MRKLLSLLLAICFVFTFAISFSSCAPKATDEPASSTEDVSEEAPDVSEEAPAVSEEAPAKK